MKKYYLRLGEEEILEEYIKAVDLLTINEESRLRRKVIELTSSFAVYDCLFSIIPSGRVHELKSDSLWSLLRIGI
jgi:hypothetical protein